MNQAQEIYQAIRRELDKVIIGQDEVIEQLLVALCAGGHVLLEGVPGTGKTLLVRSLAQILGLQFRRVQFTPDLMPSDITGTNVFDQKGGEFYFKKGPVFTNILLADEINRTPPKTQAALMESMEEKQVTTDGESRSLPAPFIVFATQNPLEHQGTYPLPEAQLDRFMFKVVVGYPEPEQEKTILKSYASGRRLHDLTRAELKPLELQAPLLTLADDLEQVVVEESILDYILRITAATRDEKDLYLGSSPRAAISLLHASRALAALQGKTYLTPDEVKKISKPVLRHRLIPVPEAEVEGITTDDILDGILARVKVPR